MQQSFLWLKIDFCFIIIYFASNVVVLLNNSNEMCFNLETIFSDSYTVSIMVYVPQLCIIINSTVCVWWILYMKRLQMYSAHGVKFYIDILNKHS